MEESERGKERYLGKVCTQRQSIAPHEVSRLHTTRLPRQLWILLLHVAREYFRLRIEMIQFLEFPVTAVLRAAKSACNKTHLIQSLHNVYWLLACPSPFE